MLESTAVWMEDKVYPQLDDYLQYLGDVDASSASPADALQRHRPRRPAEREGVRRQRLEPLARRAPRRRQVRRAWEHSLSTSPARSRPAPTTPRWASGSGSSFFDAFTRSPRHRRVAGDRHAVLRQGADFPDMVRVRDNRAQRRSSSARTAPARAAASTTRPSGCSTCAHGRPADQAGVHLAEGRAPRIALVGRNGDEVAGRDHASRSAHPEGGRASVTLAEPRALPAPDGGHHQRRRAHLGASRETRRLGVRRTGRRDRAHLDRLHGAVAARPRAAPDARDRLAPARASWSVLGAGRIGVSEHAHAACAHRPRGEGEGEVRPQAPACELTPQPSCSAGTRYTVQLSTATADGGGNSLPSKQRRWTFTTRR